MKTSKPISTIAYQTEPYLRQRLRELVKQGTIEFFCYIRHKPEEDESKGKPHIHLLVYPAKMVQTNDIRDYLKEYDPKHPDKPLSTAIWTSTKRFGDWYLYAVHDKAYLASKGQSRRYHYAFNDIVTDDLLTLNDLYQSIDLMEVSKYKAMLDAQSKGLSWDQFFLRGTVPIQQINQWREAWYTCKGLRNNDLTMRNGKETHTPKTPDDLLDDYLTLCRSHEMSEFDIFNHFSDYFNNHIDYTDPSFEKE